MTVRIITGDCHEKLRELPSKSMHCVITSPPYFGLRDYGTATWEGGDPNCSHVLDADKVERYSGRSSGSTLVGTTTHQEQAAIARHDCKCGAVRIDNQIGLEQTPHEYVAKMVQIFREVRRVLRDDGTVWLNLGDSYSSGYRTTQNQQTLRKNGYKQMTLFEDVRPVGIRRKQTSKLFGMLRKGAGRADGNVTIDSPRNRDGITSTDIPGKNMMGIPFRVAFALQDDGWYLRQDIVWSKPNPLPESVQDRCTKSHEFIFLLTKKDRYFYDAEAIAEPVVKIGTVGHLTPGVGSYQNERHTPVKSKKAAEHGNGGGRTDIDNHPSGGWAPRKTGGNFSRAYAEAQPDHGAMDLERDDYAARNKRDVWTVATQPYPEAHFATFPPALIVPSVLAGTSEKGCCAKCGAPLVRQVERAGGSYAERKAKGIGGPYNGKPEEYQTCGTSASTTVGWKPSCKCNAGIVPCRILDPFAGAGTTGMVADRFGRDAVLIELNAKYADMIERRMHDDAGMFADVVTDDINEQPHHPDCPSVDGFGCRCDELNTGVLNE